MNKEEFYKRKIFFKEGVPFLKNQYKTLEPSIDEWYNSIEFSEIQKLKGKLHSKIIQFLKNEGIEIEITPDFLYNIYQWFNLTEKKCHYCRLLEEDLNSLKSLPNYINKRYPKRGKVLEIDRKNPVLPYTDIENLVLSCYWCNNAKTDTFTETEFLQIGQEIKRVWENRLNKRL